MQTVLATTIDPKRFWGIGEVLKLSIPTCLGMLNGTIMQFVDGFMVAHLKSGGPQAISAQANAGILSFVPTALMFGALTVVNTYVSQNLGARRPEKCSQYAWQGIYLSCLFSLLLLPLAAVAGPLFALFGHTADVRGLEVMYFQYMIYGTALFILPNVLQQFFFGIERPAVVFAGSVVSNAVNLVLAYGLIYGAWGFPAMGLKGSAIATLVGSGAGLVVLAAVFLFGPAGRTYATRRQTRVRPEQMRELLTVGWPAGFQLFVDISGWSVFLSVLVGGLKTVHGVFDAEASTVHLTASSVAWRYLPMSFMPAVGIGVATTALVGRCIGEKRPDLVWRRTGAALVLAMLYMGACGLAFMLFRKPLVELFVRPPGGQADPFVLRHSAEIIAIGGQVMICAAVFQLFDAIGIVFISALRGAGDTLFPAVVCAAVSVTVMMGGGYAMIHAFPSLESVGVWMAGSAYVMVNGLVMFLRFRGGKWRRINLLNGKHTPEAGISPALTAEEEARNGGALPDGPEHSEGGRSALQR